MEEKDGGCIFMTKTKRFAAWACSALLTLGMLAGCGSSTDTTAPTEDTTAQTAAAESTESVTLTVFAAASLTETLQDIAEQYKEVAPDVEIVYNFDSSGTLSTQIQSGADCDLFLSAGQKQMNAIDVTAEANTDKLDFIQSDTRVDFLSNSVVLIVPKDSDKGITSFEDVGTDKVSLIALGNADVPAGQYAEQVFTSLNLWDALQADQKITYATNVKEVLTQVAQAAADCGVVYATDAAVNEDVAVAAAAPEGSHKPIVYPAAVLKNAAHPDEAKAFLDYLQSDACKDVFTAVGFTVL